MKYIHYFTYLSKLSPKGYFIFIVIAGLKRPSAHNTNKKPKPGQRPGAGLAKPKTSLQLESKLQIARIIRIFRILNDSDADVSSTDQSNDQTEH